LFVFAGVVISTLFQRLRCGSGSVPVFGYK